MVKLIGDIGSCHQGRLEYAREAIKVGLDSGLDAVKFQLFKNLPPNIELPYEWFPELVQYGKDLGIEVFASAFDDESYCLICDFCNSIKFSYSERNNPKIVWTPNKRIYVSGDLMTKFYNNTIKLYCIPQYPVPFIIDFEGVFPRFDGFSDHTLGYKQTLEAVRQGAQIIEKHFTLDYADINCPDNNFALKPAELAKMVKAIRFIESESRL